VCKREEANWFDLSNWSGRPMAKTEIRQLDSLGEIYAAVDETGAIIGTGTKEVCQFLMMLANEPLKTTKRINVSTRRTARAQVRSAIEI
jgi:hypothetical protein